MSLLFLKHFLKAFLFGLITIITLGGLAYWFFLNPNIPRSSAPLKIELLPIKVSEQDCRLDQGPCQIQLSSEEHLKVTLLPHPIKMNVPLELKISFYGSDSLLSKWKALAMDFNGVDMNMGYTRPSIQSTSKNKFSTTVYLPTCTQEKMLWKGLLILEASNKTWGVPFLFEASK